MLGEPPIVETPTAKWNSIIGPIADSVEASVFIMIRPTLQRHASSRFLASESGDRGQCQFSPPFRAYPLARL